ncbi:DHH family phosphoesterase [[Clostridium] hylemonae]|uniref:Cyclic-di-AMP phosphodiesterase n=1 Tax=[Clostridium] hylemonae DSM 15053 TaxID=553973 RepID=C0C5P1_9FIRM|nr:DHH family phosphoesterase [[Clostridium] hylemonae]EEG72425.1 DHHA1 domain protein [[Clostridium] hylemonae DSM 15053]QEK16601.1 Cyclic-di-AMP phosphodiesterase GdpP [[Clostridium] hylemonae DSM 15053]
MKENKKVQLKGQLRLYMQWPAIMALFLVAVNIWIYKLDRRAGTLMFIFLLIYIVMVGILYLYSKSVIMKDLVEFAAQYGIVQNTLLRELSVPYAILLEDGKAIWMNDKFEEIFGRKPKGEAYVSKYIPELNKNIFPKEEDEIVEMDVYYENREYKAVLRRVSVAGFSETEQLMELPEEREYFIAVYLNDVTELNVCKKENEEQRLVAGLIYIDNYDEVINSVEEVRQSLLMALVDRKINQYIARVDGIVKKLENDKYFIAIKKQYFKKLEQDKFSLLEDVKSVNIGNGIPATLSIGLGLSNSAYSQSYNYARVAIDLALARGGDQAVIKDCSGITYYGGKREQTSKNTRVKARVKAEALREFITVKEHILVMGHKLTDVDSFGAAVGIYRAAAALEKKAHIIINEVSASLRPLYEVYANDPAYPEDLFLNSQQAIDMADADTMVVVVDTNRPQMTECEELLRMTRTIVVLDHHRQSSDNIDNALLSYIEPYASSACEMVAEVLQYIVDDIKIPNIEASSLYAGIMIDTNNFMNRTGVRTFEAAAFLRRCGADITLVRKMFRDDMDAYRAKAEIISSAEVYEDKFAIARGTGLAIESPTIIGAQAANELLDISQIKASFVLTEYNGKIYISARSIDEVNVQIIMERLGGGGHMNAAGAQLLDVNMDQAVEKLQEVIHDMVEGGDI